MNTKENLFDFINDCRELCNNYNDSIQRDNHESFNVFKLISDRYYREDFHSDIMAFFLNPKENHLYDNVFLKLFIRMLNEKRTNINSDERAQTIIDECLYYDAIIKREFPIKNIDGEGRIDILIMSEENKCAIIVENKINNAGDTYKQLPKYYNYLTELKYRVDAIVYLPLDSYKKPNENDWTDEDKSNIEPLLLVIPAYNKSHQINVVDNWLLPAVKNLDMGDVSSVLNQYADLVKKLNKEMNKSIMEDFYGKLREGDNLKMAKTINELLNNYQQFLAQRITDKYSNNNCYPFPCVSYVSSYGGYAFFQTIDELDISMNVCGNINYFDIRLENHCPKNTLNFNVLKRKTIELNPSWEYQEGDDSYFNFVYYNIKDEDALIRCIDNIRNELSKLVSK